MLLCSVSSGALSQDVAVEPTKPSRIAPSIPPSSPPAVIVTAPRADQSADGSAPRFVTGSQLADGVQTCMAVVSPSFSVNPQILVQNGWSWGAPQTMSNGRTSYQAVRYYKHNAAIALLDTGSAVSCRFVGAVGSTDPIQWARTSLISALGAVPIGDVPRLASLRARFSSANPSANLANMLVKGDYSFEITAQERELRDPASAVARTIRLVSVESFPLPPQFRLPPSNTPAR